MLQIGIGTTYLKRDIRAQSYVGLVNFQYKRFRD